MSTEVPGAVYTTKLPVAKVTFDLAAFDRLIKTSGVTFKHWRAMRCPVGMTDQYDTRRVHDGHSGCSNGFIYTYAGEVTCSFMGNQTGHSMSEIGRMDGSTVHVTLPRFYDGPGSRPVQILPFDRLFLAEEAITVGHWQAVEHNASGKDRLNFPVVDVIDLIDSQGKVYGSTDFEVVGGQIYWGPNRPGLDPELGKGRVYAVRYTYRPYWYVKTLVHEVRVAQVENPYTGLREVNRVPQEAMLQREYIFEKEEKDEQAREPDSVRQVSSPGSGLFGPR